MSHVNVQIAGARLPAKAAWRSRWLGRVRGVRAGKDAAWLHGKCSLLPVADDSRQQPVMSPCFGALFESQASELASAGFVCCHPLPPYCQLFIQWSDQAGPFQAHRLTDSDQVSMSMSRQGHFEHVSQVTSSPSKPNDSFLSLATLLRFFAVERPMSRVLPHWSSFAFPFQGFRDIHNYCLNRNLSLSRHWLRQGSALDASTRPGKDIDGKRSGMANFRPAPLESGITALTRAKRILYYCVL